MDLSSLDAHSQPVLQEPSDRLFSELETERLTLSQRLQSVENRLRELRTSETVCSRCGGAGVRALRGGLYGERQLTPCECRTGAQ